MGVDAPVVEPSAVLASAAKASALAGGRDGVVGVGVDVVCVPKMSRLVSEGGLAFLRRGWTSHDLPKRATTRNGSRHGGRRRKR